MRQKLIELQQEIDESTIIIGTFNTPLSEMDKSHRQEICKDKVELSNTINQLDITDTYRLYFIQRLQKTYGTFHVEYF